MSPHIAWVPIGTIASALATAGMAVFTARMAGATSRSVKTTEAALDLERQSIEGIRDSLMPVLAIEWNLVDKNGSESADDVFALSLKNLGVGPAFIHEITTREEVSRRSIHHHVLRTRIISAGGHESATLNRTDAPDMSHNAISSISVWYTDAYGRWYRTRLVFQYIVDSRAKRWFRVRPWVSEFQPNVAEPSFSDNSVTNLYPKNYVGRFELGRLARVNSLEYPDLHTLRARDRAMDAGLVVSPTAIANGQSVHIEGISWWFGQSRPEVHLQVSNYKPFVLGIRDGRDDASEVAVIIDAPLLASFSTSNPPPLPNPIEADQLDGWGLRNSVSVGNDLLELHGLAIKAIRAHLSPD